MALGRFVLEGANQGLCEQLSKFLDLIARCAAESTNGIIKLDEIGPYYGMHNHTDVFITDAQWCTIDRSAISLRAEGDYSDMLSCIVDMVSFIDKDISVFYSITDFENRVAVTNDIDSKYYDSRMVMLLSINPKLARINPGLYESLQDMVGGAYRFNNESSMRQFVFETFGFRPVSRKQIAEIVELYSYQILLDSGLNLDVDEALTNTEFIKFIVKDQNEGVVS